MKAFLLVAIAIGAAVAEPESDPNLVYTNGQFHTNYANLVKGVHTPYAVGYGSLYNSFPAYYNPYVAHRVFKREAKAESKSDAFLPYYGSTYYNGVPAVRAGYAYSAYTPYTTGYTAASVYNPYVARVFKREAESEPEADADAFLPYYGSTYYNGVPAVRAGYAYSAYTPYTRYSGVYNPYVARVFKREAEAESDADAYLPYYGSTVYSGYHGVPYTTGYTAYSGYAPAVVRPAVYGAYRYY